MTTTTASENRRKPGTIIYTNDNMRQLIKKSSALSEYNCKKPMTDAHKKKDTKFDNCFINEEIELTKVLKDAQTSPRLIISFDSKKSGNHESSPVKSSSVKSSRKQLLNPAKPEEVSSPPPVINDRILEKSNSLGDSKPIKELRTTKSLSPRPPIRHQHCITFSDENSIVSIKMSPDFDDTIIKHPPIEAKPIISDSSPDENAIVNVGGNLRLDDRHKNNRSTSCLLYEPADPWTKIDLKRGKKKIGTSCMKKLSDMKSLSRPDLATDDPWVLDENRRKTKDTSRKVVNNQQGHSKSVVVESKSATPLQRSKSPIFFHLDDHPTSPPSVISPHHPLSSLSPKLETSDENGRSGKKKSQFLNVSNPNLLQPRHSFSTTPIKDDELTLNIRRLSEQIKYTNYGSYSNFTEASSTVNNTSPKLVSEIDHNKSVTLLNDSLLETTC